MRIQSFDYSVNLLRALLWQYNDAERLQGLLTRKAAWYDVNHVQFWTDWGRDVFDVRTANDFGLCVWAAILGLPIAALPTDDPNKPIWGFGGVAGTDADFRQNYENGNFAAGGYVLFMSLEQKRKAVQLRYFQLISNGSVTTTNDALAYVFGPGVVSVWTSPDMKIRYAFVSSPGAALESVLNQYDLLPRPAGVLADFIVNQYDIGYGFEEYRDNFTNGNFYYA